MQQRLHVLPGAIPASGILVGQYDGRLTAQDLTALVRLQIGRAVAVAAAESYLATLSAAHRLGAVVPPADNRADPVTVRLAKERDHSSRQTADETADL